MTNSKRCRAVGILEQGVFEDVIIVHRLLGGVEIEVIHTEKEGERLGQSRKRAEIKEQFAERARVSGLAKNQQERVWSVVSRRVSWIELDARKYISSRRVEVEY
tara:strand:- start:30 stop:341 length:312 start_codon:yes stop_codon:yes gene_type:complete